MKKFKKFLAILILASIALTVTSAPVSAQSTSPRYGTASNQDNTGRVLTYKYSALLDTAGADSAIIRPDGWEHVYKVTLTDSFTLKSPVTTKSYYGDQVTLIATGSSGNKLKFTGTNWVSAGTATLSSGLKAIITFRFDGSKYVEQSRVVQ